VQAYSPAETLFAYHPWKLLSYFSPWRLSAPRTLQELYPGSYIIPAPGCYDNQLATRSDLRN
jgi:hypothetical protein